MSQLKVISIQRDCVYDGPGVRTTVFLKGCVLNCPWCCNPEAISLLDDYFIDDSKCLLLKGINSRACHYCQRKGGTRSIVKCPFGICEPTSFNYTIDALCKELLKDKNLFVKSSGGITLSGGEPLLHKNIVELAKKIKEAKIDIYVETTLIIPLSTVEECNNFIDGYIVDLKVQKELNLYNQVDYIEKLRENISLIREEKKNVIFRLVFVDSIIEIQNKVIDVLKYLDVKNVEILSCHNLAQSKYEKLNKIFKDYSPNKENLSLFMHQLNINEVKTRLLMV